MITDFDNAVLSHIKQVFPNTYYANTAIVYNVVYNLADKDSLGFALQFPFISIYRPTGFEVSKKQNFAARRIGHYFDYKDGIPTAARFMLARLPYQFDIYAKSQEQLNDISEQFMKYLNFRPVVLVNQQLNAETIYSEQYLLNFESGANELSEFTNDDRVYHYAFVYAIDEAKIVDFKPNIPIINDVDVEGNPLGVQPQLDIEMPDGTYENTNDSLAPTPEEE